MSITVTIDKAALVDAIAGDVCAACGTVGGFDPCASVMAMYNPIPGAGVNISCTNGWVVFSGVQGYPKLMPRPQWVPYGILDNTKVIIMFVVAQVRKVNNAYIHFNEPAPGYASYVEGFYLSGGYLRVRSPETPNVNAGSTQMAVSPGDTIFLMNIWGNDNGVVFNRFIAGHYDWTNDTYTVEIDAYVNPSNVHQWRYFVVMEPDNTDAELAFTPWLASFTQTYYFTATTGSPDPAAFARLLKKAYGIGSPPPVGGTVA